MKCRSEALEILGTARASMFLDWRTEVRSSRARPEETEFMRTASSVMFGGRVWERKDWRLERASGFLEGVTLSSRS